MRPLLLIGLLVAVPPASADEGHFSLLRGGFGAGFTDAPVPFADLSDAPDSHDAFGGVVAPFLQVQLDARVALISVEGMYNLVRQGAEWNGRGEIVFAKLLGLRTSHNLVKSISDSSPDSSGNVTRTVETYTNLTVPMIFGLSAGFSIWHLSEVSYTAPSYTVPEGVTNTRSAATIETLDVGATLRSPQLEVSLAPMKDFTSGSWGIRWSYGMALPIGDYPFWFRFTGDHLLGSNPLDNSGKRMSATLMLVIGFGTGLGLPL
jgi:hypothetical protein